VLKLPQLEHPRRIARLAEQPAAWAHYLVGRRRKRVAAAVPPEVFDPASIASLRLWLRGDDIGVSDGLPVSLWPDASGHGNDVEQITGMKQPTFMSAQLGVHSFVRFDGVDDTLFKSSANGFTCATGHTIIAVMNPTTAASFGMAVVTNYQCNEMRQGGSGGTAQWMIPSGFNLVDGWDDLTGLWKVWAGTYNVATDTMGLFINGVDQGTNVDAGTLAVGDIYLGSRTDTYHWIGDIAEVLVFDDVLSATDRGNVESYLMGKYGLA
jgi:hypothetical protein